MAWNYRCRVCGCMIDPGERICDDCREEEIRKEERREWFRRMGIEECVYYDAGIMAGKS